MNIPVELNTYDKKEIFKECIGDSKLTVHNFGMYEKYFFKGQKILIVMLYSYGMNEGEDKRLSYENLLRSLDGYECFKSSIEYTGIQAEVVINYKDAIERLTRQSIIKNCCDYYACIIISGEPYPELPNPNDDPYLLGQFIKVIEQFWKNGGSLGLFADNAPFNYQINIIIEKLFPDSKFRVAGNHLGRKKIFGDKSGKLSQKATFNQQMQMIDKYSRSKISHSLIYIYEGKTISYFVEKPEDDDLLYYGKNEELKMITDSNLLFPFIPFSKDSDGGFNSALYCSNDDKGDIIIDCSYTKLFFEMEIEGTPRYIQNLVSWLAAPEKHFYKDNCKDGNSFRPKSINLNIDWNDKWTGFKERPIYINFPENMKTLFVVDCSDNAYGQIKNIYFSNLRMLINKYYQSFRGDKFYIFGKDYKCLNEIEMEKFISGEYIGVNTNVNSYLIAEIGRETKDEKFEHLIIVTASSVNSQNIDMSDQKVNQYGIKYSFVSNYMIGNEANLSVAAPYFRFCPGINYLIDNNGNIIKSISLSRKDKKALDDIDIINSWSEFKSKYQNIYNAIKVKYLTKELDPILKDKLNSLNSRLTDIGLEKKDFQKKFDILYKMVNGKISGTISIAG